MDSTRARTGAYADRTTSFTYFAYLVMSVPKLLCLIRCALLAKLSPARVDRIAGTMIVTHISVYFEYYLSILNIYPRIKINPPLTQFKISLIYKVWLQK